MSEKPTILIQLDTDPLPSVFDRVVAVDAACSTCSVTVGHRSERDAAVHGCIFTRGPKDLHRPQFSSAARMWRRVKPFSRRCEST